MALPSLSSEKSIADYWGLPTNAGARFSNARSALAMLVSTIQPKRAWIPAYVCHSVAEVFDTNNVPIFYYSVSDTLEPDVFQLKKDCTAGDMVFGINYFGQAPSASFCHFAHQRDDLIFVEDCAQTIDTGKSTWGNWRLISPRKVVGVADGGFILPSFKTSKCKIKFSAHRNSEIDIWHAAVLRFEDNTKKNNQYWHSINQEHEKNIVINDTRMTRLSYELLKHIDAPSIIQQRKINFDTLHARLAHIAFLPVKKPDFCPFGFPIRLNENFRTIMNNELIKRGIFPAIHWISLPSPSDQFDKEHLLAKELLTLPCDQRYNISDMQYIATNVLDILKKNP